MGVKYRENANEPWREIEMLRGPRGISPIISVTNIPGGHRLTIKDKDGEKSIDILNGTGAGDMVATTYDPQGKAQDVFAYADKKLPLAGGTMTGAITLPAGTFIMNQNGNVRAFQNPALFNAYGLSTVGTIAINLGKDSRFFAMDFSLASYDMNILLNLSGYTYPTSPVFHSPLATGICNGFAPKVRVAVDGDGNRYFLLGEVDTDWGGYIRAGGTKLVQYSGTYPNMTISLITDETDLFTYQAEVAINNVVPYDPANLSAAVPIEKGGTGAASAADALAKLGALPLTGGTITGESGTHADTPLLLRSASTSSFLGFKNQSGTELGYLGFDANKTPTVYIGNIGKKLYHEGYKPTASDVGAPTVDEMNTAIANAIGTALEASY